MPGANDRGSWMTSKIFCIPLAQFLTTLFSRSPKFVTFFASVVKFHENSLLGCPPVLHHAAATTFFTSFLVIKLHFLKKTGPLDAPQGGCRGSRTVRTPSARHWETSLGSVPTLHNFAPSLKNCVPPKKFL